MGVSNSTVGNNFAVSGNRPQQNLFLLNGVEFSGAAENNMQPGGVSQQLLGVDAVREFNVLRDSYGAEYGKRPARPGIDRHALGDEPGTWQRLRVSSKQQLRSPNYFDQGSAPPFQRNQFGGALEVQIQRNKTFLFGNYEGLRQHLHQTGVDLVPDANARQGYLPCKLVTRLRIHALRLGSSTLALVRACSLCLRCGRIQPRMLPTTAELLSPITIRCKPFETTLARFASIGRFPKRHFQFCLYDRRQRRCDAHQQQSLQHGCGRIARAGSHLDEIHVFTPTPPNTARAGFTRASYFFTGEPSPNASRRLARICRQSSSRRRCRGRKLGVQSSSASEPGGKQQWQQSRCQPEFVHIRGPRHLDKGRHQFTLADGFKDCNPTKNWHSANSARPRSQGCSNS